jgi:dipeptidyl aminopeptidase/acylaminoacyl peptidase
MATSKRRIADQQSVDRRDLRETPLYKEAEALFQQVLRPGSGRPTSAVVLMVSPDGRHVAFAGTMLEKLEGLPSTRICIVELQSGDLRIVSFGPHSDLGPKFSPDGEQLVFRSDRLAPGDFQLYILNLKSGETRAAPVVDGWVEYHEFSPDGTHLLIGVAGHGADVSGGQGAKTSQTAATGRDAAWMPKVETGDEAFKRRSSWTLNLKSGVLKKVSPPELNIWEACWCGADSIAAVVSKGASEEDWYRAYVVAIKLAGGSTRILYEPQTQLGWPSASADGKKLAFVEAVSSDRWIVAGDLRIVDLVTGKLQTPETHGIDVTFTLWRNNKQMLLAGIRNLDTVIADFSVASQTVHELWKSSTQYCQNFFYPTAAACPGSAGGFVIATTAHLQPTQLIHVARSKSRKVCDFAHSGTDAVVRTLRPVLPYRWKAPDGTEIQGWLMKGAGKQPAPLVMDVHGGPIWRWPPFFLGRSPLLLMLAARGCALFWPNPRGSSGRGQSFAQAVVGDMGGADTKDYLSGLDQLVADGIADPKRIGVTGGSYGGFMSAWLITQDQRFAAAVPVAPVTDWVSQHLTSNIPYFDSFCLGSQYTDQGGNHFARSPVMFAQRVKTPTLNICGALDRCTPPGQAQEFHNALLENGAKSVLVTYPQEGHGVRAFPAAIDYAARVVAWFNRYLGLRA